MRDGLDAERYGKQSQHDDDDVLEPRNRDPSAQREAHVQKDDGDHRQAQSQRQQLRFKDRLAVEKKDDELADLAQQKTEVGRLADGVLVLACRQQEHHQHGRHRIGRTTNQSGKHAVGECAAPAWSSDLDVAKNCGVDIKECRQRQHQQQVGLLHPEQQLHAEQTPRGAGQGQRRTAPDHIAGLVAAEKAQQVDGECRKQRDQNGRLKRHEHSQRRRGQDRKTDPSDAVQHRCDGENRD